MFLSIVIILLLVLLAVILAAPLSIECTGAVGGGAGRGVVRCFWLHPWILKGVLDNKDKTFRIIAFGVHRLYVHGAQAVSPPQRQKKPGAGDHPAAHEEPLDEPKEAPSGPHAPAAREQKAGEKPGRPRFVQVKRLWVYLGNDSFRGKLIRWLGRTLRFLFRICSVGHIRVRVRMGFDDPAATGTAYGCYIGLRNMLADGRRPRCNIVYEPAFAGEPFEAQGEAAIETSVARLCLPVMVALGTFPYLSAFLLYRTARKIDKK